jgi:hypothetical protein
MGKFALIFMAFAVGEYVMRSMTATSDQPKNSTTPEGHTPFIDESVDIAEIGRVNPEGVPVANIPHLKFMYCIG